VRVAIYAIARDEARHVRRFVDACRDADLVLVADTGSTDDTVDRLREAGAVVHSIAVSPWRFDVARNAALALVPSHLDLCIALDLDEILDPGWRGQLERAFDPEATRYRYEYTWSFDAEGRPALSFRGERIHVRNGYLWEYPCHEVVRWVGNGPERVVETRVAVGHYPDAGRSRGQYLDLLALGARERPEDPRMAYYYGRELFFRQDCDAAIRELERYLGLPASIWREERSQAWIMIGRCHKAQDRAGESLGALVRAAQEADRRECWVALAHEYYERQEWALCYVAASRCLAITEPNGSFLNEGSAWGALPHDLASIAAYHLGIRDKALEHVQAALDFAPDDERLLGNLKLIRDS